MFGGGGTYVLRSGGKLRERDMERMETQTNNHYSISTKYGINLASLTKDVKDMLLCFWHGVLLPNLHLQHNSQHNS